MIAPFTYTANPARVLFGPGRLGELGAELERLGCRRAMLLSGPEQAETIRSRLGTIVVGQFTRATMHTPTNITAEALEQVTALRCDGLVAIGGGSAIGLGKALALRTGLPHIAVPTTYAGSEMTTILGETEGGRKTTQNSPKVLPEVVIYDVDLTLSLPPFLSAVSGFNALAHAVEALYAREANPIISLMAEEAIMALGRSLPRVVADGRDQAARVDAQYGAWLSATCLGVAGVALHHKICHVLGGLFDLRHAETHTVMLPHVVAYNTMAVPEVMGRISRALGSSDAASGLFDLSRALGAPHSLRDLGMPEVGIDRAIEQVMQNQYWNPGPPDAEALRAMLTRAWSGETPLAA